ncbi:hypothetical protein [Bradyrhizobium sp. WSM1417]|uniref:hypothetical protein n=1 Tax=Bradyrhizobium sp. WSM1417 TaxID=754500 RepID=UPI0012EB9568|nr:hypothetical protein [Bradyrhizobium sp. WSM1417]
MAPLPSLPPQFDLVKTTLLGANKTPQLRVFGTYPIKGPYIKANEIYLTGNAALEFEDTNNPFWIVYADDWYLNGHFEIRRTTTNLPNLDGANGANAPSASPTPAGDGVSGNDGLMGLPGRQGLRGSILPQVVIIAQRVFVQDGAGGWRRANGADIDAVFNLDGVDGGNGGDGGDGSDGTDGNRGSPAVDGGTVLGIGNCACGPGQGGRGGNAGLGGWPGYGGDGGDGATLFMFVATDELQNFGKVVTSLNGGNAGQIGKYGNPGHPGKGGDEGDYSQTDNCYSAGRFGVDGIVPHNCYAPEVKIHAGASGKTLLTDYSGFAELGN